MSRTLRETRRSLRLTLSQLAEVTGIGKSTLGNYETGTAVMSDEKLKRIATVLKTSLDEILPGSRREPSKLLDFSTPESKRVTEDTAHKRITGILIEHADTDTLRQLLDVCEEMNEARIATIIGRELGRRAKS